MKKITFCTLMFAGVALFAQHAQQSISVGSVKNGLEPVDWKPSDRANKINNNSLLSGVFHYQLVWAAAKEKWDIDTDNADATNFATYRNVIFMDSTAVTSSASGNDNPFNMRAGVVVDPKSPYYNPDQSGVPYLTASDAYQVDTVLVDGNYQRRVSVDDTLIVELSWGDTANYTTWTQVYNTTKNQYWICPKVNSSKLHGNVSHLAAAAGNRVIVKRVMTAADTITVGNPFAGAIVVVMPAGGVKIPAGNPVAVSYTFVPGSYNNGDVVFQYSNPTTPATKNGFGGYLRGQKDYSGTNGLSYFYDRDLTQPNPDKTKNSSMDYYTNGRYGRYTGGQAFANSCMYPGADFCWYIETIISNQVVGIDEHKSNNLRVGQNIPNPFNESTYIGYELVESANVTLEVFDITGKKVQAINEGKKFAGNYNIQFNGSNLQAGVYFYTLTAGETRVTKRMTLVK